MKNKVAKALTLTLASTLLLAACSGDKTPTNKSKVSSDDADKQLKVLNLSQGGELMPVDSSIAEDSDTFDVLNNVMEGLLRLDGNNKPTEGIAKSYDVSEDGKTYTFHLRDAKWSNGDNLTAHDFVYAWQRTLDPKTASSYAYIMYDIKNAEDVNSGKKPLNELGVKATDDHTLVVELNANSPYFLGLTTFPSFFPQNKKAVEKYGKKYGTEANSTVYDGPFVLDSWEHDANWTLKKNENYWDKNKVKLDEVRFSVIKKVPDAVSLYLTDKLDKVYLDSDFVDQYREDPNFKTALFPTTYYLSMNRNSVLDNKNIRIAISEAIDKESFTKILLNDGSVPAGYLVPKEFVNSPSDNKDFRSKYPDFYTYDKNDALKHFNEGKKEIGKSEIHLVFLAGDTEKSIKISEFVKSQLEKNLPGLKIEVKNLEYDKKTELERKGEYDISYQGWAPDYLDPISFLDLFTSNGGFNITGYANPKYDKVMKDARGSLLNDMDKRWIAFQEAEKLLIQDDVVIAPLYQQGRAYLQKERYTGNLIHPFGAELDLKEATVK